MALGGSADAGAYLMPPGEGQVIAEAGFSGSTRALDAQGRVIPVPSYRKFELGTYVEYGVTDWLTLVGAPSYDHIRAGVPGSSYDGLGESEIGARAGLYRSESNVVSVQASFISPGAPFAQGTELIRARRAAAADLRLMAAQNFEIASLPFFFEGGAGHRFYRGDQPGEWCLDLTLGARPSPNLLFMLQSFSSIFDAASTLWPRQSWHRRKDLCASYHRPT